MMSKERNPFCPDGHGPMERQPGFWALQGVKFSGGTASAPEGATLTEEGMVMKVWTCPTCNVVRLYSDDAE